MLTSFRKHPLATVYTASILLLCSMLSYTACLQKPKDVYKQVVMLKNNNKGSCSGQQIIAKSGIKYILSAAHCKVLSDDGQNINVITESGRELKRRIIAIDSNADLMLIEGAPGLEGLDIAQSSRAREHVETYTHGSGMDTYETDGVIIGDMEINFIVGQISTPEDAANCNTGTLHARDLDSFFGPISVCVFTSNETVITAKIVPGSSGGAIVNERHELVGVASATDGQFGFMVRLKDIQKFLNNY